MVRSGEFLAGPCKRIWGNPVKPLLEKAGAS